jgi:hypothetical protein
MGQTKFPIGGQERITIENAATSTITIANTKTYVEAGTISQAITGLSLTADEELIDGAEVIIDIQQGATGRNVSFGSAGNTIVAPNLTGVADDRDILTLTYVKGSTPGSGEFVAKLAAWEKIVNAA